MIEFKLSDYYNGDEIYLENMYHKKDITLESGLTVLVGCNGSGKTTFMKELKGYCQNNDIPVMYKNLEGCGHDLMSKYSYHENYEGVAAIMSSSEGEILREGAGDSLAQCGRFVRDNAGKDKIVIMMDAFDSGSSIDNIIDLKDAVRFMIEDIFNQRIEPYIIISANAYEVANGENCLLVNEGEYRKFRDYEEYKEYILRTSEYKYDRYNRNNADVRELGGTEE